MGGAAYLLYYFHFFSSFLYFTILRRLFQPKGGAIYYRVSTTTEEGFVCRGCNNTGNRAKLLGGAMYIMQGGVFLEAGTRLEDNIADSQGGES
jgi:hypothetical protein